MNKAKATAKALTQSSRRLAEFRGVGLATDMVGGLGLERLVAVDWSGRVDAAGQRRHIWAGVWTWEASGKVRVTLEAGRTREEVGEWLVGMARETPRMVVSVDCCFSYPAWFLREHGCATVFEFWEKVAAGKGEEWLARECVGTARDVRFWGKPGLGHDGKRPAVFCGEGMRAMFRATDYENKIEQALAGGDVERAAKMKGIQPKSPFQIGGSGSVGTGSLRAVGMLRALHAAGFKVWPFESAALETGSKRRFPAGMTKQKVRARPRPLLVEMYTRLMTGAVAKSNAGARAAYLKARVKHDALFAGISRGVLAKAAGSEDAFDALVSVVEMVRYAGEFAGLKKTRDEGLRLEGITWRPGVS